MLSGVSYKKKTLSRILLLYIWYQFLSDWLQILHSGPVCVHNLQRRDGRFRIRF